jgi:hypothetical protein
VRRTIRPELGHLKVRKVKGPILDTFYAWLKKCGDLACSGKRFTEHMELAPDAYLFSNDPMHATPWNPDWASHKVSALAAAAGVKLNIKGLRHYTASQLLAARFDLRNTAARLGHSGGGATTLRHYADPCQRSTGGPLPTSQS